MQMKPIAPFSKGKVTLVLWILYSVFNTSNLIAGPKPQGQAERNGEKGRFRVRWVGFKGYHGAGGTYRYLVCESAGRSPGKGAGIPHVFYLPPGSVCGSSFS